MTRTATALDRPGPRLHPEAGRLRTRTRRTARRPRTAPRRLGGEFLEIYREVESGKHRDIRSRPRLMEAAEHAVEVDATLVIAKLDRLVRNASVLQYLRDMGVKFVACDNPHANKLTVHILVGVAENEAELISQRTRDALARLPRRPASLAAAPREVPRRRPARGRGGDRRQARRRAAPVPQPHPRGPRHRPRPLDRLAVGRGPRNPPRPSAAWSPPGSRPSRASPSGPWPTGSTRSAAARPGARPGPPPRSRESSTASGRRDPAGDGLTTRTGETYHNCPYRTFHAGRNPRGTSPCRREARVGRSRCGPIWRVVSGRILIPLASVARIWIGRCSARCWTRRSG